MAKVVHDVSKKRQVPLWASILIICVLLVVALLLAYAAFHNLNNSVEGKGFATTNAAAESTIVLGNVSFPNG